MKISTLGTVNSSKNHGLSYSTYHQADKISTYCKYTCTYVSKHEELTEEETAPREHHQRGEYVADDKQIGAVFVGGERLSNKAICMIALDCITNRIISTRVQFLCIK